MGSFIEQFDDVGMYQIMVVASATKSDQRL